MNFRGVLEQFEAFSLKDLQTFNAVISVAKRKKVPLKTLVSAVDELQQSIAAEVGKQRKEVQIVRLCPECQTQLEFRGISTPKGARNINGYTWNWACMKCDFEEYTYETPEDVLEKYGVEPE